MQPLFAIDRLRDRVTDNCLILTPNQRLASKIRQAWNLDRQHRQPVWKPLPVLALDTWVSESWLALQDRAYPPALSGTLLDSAQERLVWQQVLEDDETLTMDASPGNFIAIAAQGWHLVNHWRLTCNDLLGQHHQGAEKLASWGRAFDQSLQQWRLVSRDEATVVVLKGFREQALPRHDEIILVGFQTLTPLHSSLIAAAADSHGHLPLSAHRRQCRVRATDNAAGEIQAAACWAKHIAATFPQARIGIVIADLANRRTEVERVFQQQLCPASILPDSPFETPDFNLSAGTALADTPLVAAALALLALNRQHLPLEHVLQLLNNPFWGADGSASAVRSGAQWRLREQGQLELGLGEFRDCLAAVEAGFTGPERPMSDDSLSAMLLAFGSDRRQRFRKQHYRQWRDHFSTQLQQLGWPGKRTLDSLEYQQFSHFARLLDNLASLDIASDPVDLYCALEQLQQLARDSIFQAETPDSAIQILGTLEAAGLQFSHLWVTGLDDSQWPQPTRPHPLLPVPLQQKLAMPRASAERELQLSRELFDLFCHSAERVVFSYSRMDGDRELLPSILIDGLPPIEDKTTESATNPYDHGMHPWTATIAATGHLEIFDDSFGLPLTAASAQGTIPAPADGQDSTAFEAVPGDNRPRQGLAVRGGSRLIQDQAACPFNAFVTWRLDARPLPEPLPGPDPLVRGNLVHRMLEAFWRDLPDRSALVALSAENLNQRIGDAIAGALKTTPLVNTGQRYLALEAERLKALLHRWLELERQRDNFRVLSLESRASVQLAGLILSLRIDRIDRLADDRLLLLDYKTGNASIKGLDQERLLAPQLALYALAERQGLVESLSSEPDLLDAGLGAVAYGIVSGRDVSCLGVSDIGRNLPGVKSLSDLHLPESWETTLAMWHNSLNNLANEYATGRAEVIFYDSVANRRQSWLQPLNRVAGAEYIQARLKPSEPTVATASDDTGADIPSANSGASDNNGPVGGELPA